MPFPGLLVAASFAAAAVAWPCDVWYIERPPFKEKSAVLLWAAGALAAEEVTATVLLAASVSVSMRLPPPKLSPLLAEAAEVAAARLKLRAERRRPSSRRRERIVAFCSRAIAMSSFRAAEPVSAVSVLRLPLLLLVAISATARSAARCRNDQEARTTTIKRIAALNPRHLPFFFVILSS